MERRTNVEFKARLTEPEKVRDSLEKAKLVRTATELQVDTYFNAPKGRLKFRASRLEQNLIFYERSDTASAKACDCKIYHASDPEALCELLSAVFGVRAVVRKQREIYRSANIQVHIDQVEGLGDFLEIEARGYADEPIALLRNQCEELRRNLGVPNEDLLESSYCEMLERT